MDGSLSRDFDKELGGMLLRDEFTLDRIELASRRWDTFRRVLVLMERSFMELIVLLFKLMEVRGWLKHVNSVIGQSKT